MVRIKKINTALILALILGMSNFTLDSFSISTSLAQDQILYSIYQNDLEKAGLEIAESELEPSDSFIEIKDKNGSSLETNQILTEDIDYQIHLDGNNRNDPILFKFSYPDDSQEAKGRIFKIIGPNEYIKEIINPKIIPFKDLEEGIYEFKMNFNPDDGLNDEYYLSISYAKVAFSEGNIVIDKNYDSSIADWAQIEKFLHERNGVIFIVGNTKIARKYGVNFKLKEVDENYITLNNDNERFLLKEDLRGKKIYAINILPNNRSTSFIIKPLAYISNEIIIAKIYYLNKNIQKINTIYAVSPNIFDLAQEDKEKLLTIIAVEEKKIDPFEQKEMNVINNPVQKIVEYLLILLFIAIGVIFFGKSLTDGISKIYLLLNYRYINTFIKEKIRTFINHKMIPIFKSCYLIMTISIILFYFIGKELIYNYKTKSKLDLFADYKIEDLLSALINSQYYYVFTLLAILFLVLILAVTVWAKSELLIPYKSLNLNIGHKLKRFKFKALQLTLLFALSLLLNALLILIFIVSYKNLLLIVTLGIISCAIIAFYYVAYIYQKLNDISCNLSKKQKIILGAVIVSFIASPLIILTNESKNLFTNQIKLKAISNFLLDIGSPYDDDSSKSIYLNNMPVETSMTKSELFPKETDILYISKKIINSFIDPYVQRVKTNEIGEKIISGGRTARIFQGNPMNVIVKDYKDNTSNASGNLYLTFFSPKPIYLSDKNNNKLLIYDPSELQFNTLSAFLDMSVLSKEKRDKINAQFNNMYEFITQSIPKNSIIKLQLPNEYENEQFRKYLVVKDKLTDNVEGNLDLRVDVIGSDYTFYTILQKSLNIKIEIQITEKYDQNKFQIMLIDKYDSIIVSKSVDNLNYPLSTVEFIRDDITPGIYQIKFHHDNDKPYQDYIIKRITLNSPKLILTDKLFYKGEKEIYLKALSKSQNLRYFDNSKQEVKTFIDKNNITSLKLPDREVEFIFGKNIVAITENSWFNPFSYYFTDETDNAEFIITKKMSSYTIRDGWIEMKKEIPLEPYKIDNMRLFFRFEHHDNNSLFLIDKLSFFIK